MSKALVLGLGNCVDFEVVWDARALEQLAARYCIRFDEPDAERAISGSRDLVLSLLGFLRAGAGGERHVPSRDVLLEVAREFETRVTVGGTSLRAAIAMRKLGYRSALHLVSMNRHVRDRLPEGCEWVCSEAEEDVHPHLIIQFPAGATIRLGGREVVAKQENRIIYVHDPVNERLRISPRLTFLSTQARVFLISGLNAMRDPSRLSDCLDQLSRVLVSLPPNAIVVYEDAEFHDPSLRTLVRDALTSRIDVYSLNEDEMQTQLDQPVCLLDPASSLSALRELQRVLAVPALVVHTRRWALACAAESGRFRGALRAGIVMAGTRLRLGDDFSRQDIEKTETLPPREDGAMFAAAINELGGGAVHCEPSILWTGAPAATVGLGDAFVGGFLPKLLEKAPV